MTGGAVAVRVCSPSVRPSDLRETSRAGSVMGSLPVLLATTLLLRLCRTQPVVFPDARAPSHIPDHILMRLSEVHNVSQFFAEFISFPQNPGGGSYEDPVARRKDSLLTGPPLATAAGCKPELQVVPLSSASDELAVLTWPSCTRVERCGGCCPSDLLRCLPTKTSIMEVKAVKARYKYSKDDKLEFEGYQTYQIEKHEKCKCQCIQKAKDCTRAQTYVAEQCKCVCANTAEYKDCIDPDKYWDIKECKCLCKRVVECSSGFGFNPRTCRCETNQVQSRFLPPEDVIHFPSSEDLQERPVYRISSPPGRRRP